MAGLVIDRSADIIDAVEKKFMQQPQSAHTFLQLEITQDRLQGRLQKQPLQGRQKVRL